MQNSETTNPYLVLPRDCKFTDSDWRALAPFWYPVAFSSEVKDRPFAAKLLDERLVIFRADYISAVSNYPLNLKHLNPPGFKWRRLFEVWLPFKAKLTVFFPNDGQLHILNAASPVSARITRVFVPICRNFDKDAPLQDAPDFNHQGFR